MSVFKRTKDECMLGVFWLVSSGIHERWLLIEQNLATKTKTLNILNITYSNHILITSIQCMYLKLNNRNIQKFRKHSLELGDIIYSYTLLMKFLNEATLQACKSEIQWSLSVFSFK